MEAVGNWKILKHSQYVIMISGEFPGFSDCVRNYGYEVSGYTPVRTKGRLLRDSLMTTGLTEAHPFVEGRLQSLCIK